MKPLIGLVGRRKKGAAIAGMPEPLHHIDADLYLADYGRGVYAGGGLPLNLPIDIDPAEYIDRIDGLVLTGGTDIAPERYGKEAESDLFAPEPERDELELAMLGLAMDRSIPVLGICRGLQMTNVHGGGTLNQDIPPHARFDIDPTAHVHTLTIDPDSVLGGLYGPSRNVNSLHHQTVDRVADGYRVTARAEDGTVEGLEHRELPVVSVQWHPEMMTTRDVDPIFGWLVESAVASRP